MRAQFAILLGKAIFSLTRFFKIGGGSAAPGLYALRVDPDLVKKLTRPIPQNIIITGTNGKTTTARMIAHFAKTAGLKVIRNYTGSNLERGIASTLIQDVSLTHLTHPGGVLHRHLGIWELDEAAFNTVTPKIKPDIIIFLNVFRDQLDRYGEVDTVVKNWCETLKKINKNTMVLVNGDDSNTLKLAKVFKGKKQRFGVQNYKIIGESIEHVKEQENLNFEAKNVKLRGLSSSSFQLQTTSPSGDPQLPTTLPLPGIYHIYDFLAAFAAGQALGFDSKKMISSLKDFSPAFGRVEKFTLQPRGLQAKVDGYIFLIKNPAGATQVFETIAPQLKKDDGLFLALNDNLADGTDVSWIWDAELEKLQATGRRLQIVVSGTRAYDLANRLKYAGFDPNMIYSEPDLEQAFKQAKKNLKGLPAGRQGRLFILPTYTAMLQLQSILAKTGIKKNYWEEE